MHLRCPDWFFFFYCSIAEHAIGLVVACMPIIPAFFRHVNHHWTQRSSKTGSETWETGIGSNSLSYRAGRPPRGTNKDPYLLSRDYKELDDLEHQRPSREDIKGTTTIIDGGHHGTTSEQTLEGFHTVPETGALVSRSVQVESHPIEAETTHAPRAHLKIWRWLWKGWGTKKSKEIWVRSNLIRGEKETRCFFSLTS